MAFKDIFKRVNKSMQESRNNAQNFMSIDKDKSSNNKAVNMMNRNESHNALNAKEKRSKNINDIYDDSLPEGYGHVGFQGMLEQPTKNRAANSYDLMQESEGLNSARKQIGETIRNAITAAGDTGHDARMRAKYNVNKFVDELNSFNASNPDSAWNPEQGSAEFNKGYEQWLAKQSAADPSTIRRQKGKVDKAADKTEQTSPDNTSADITDPDVAKLYSSIYNVSERNLPDSVRYYTPNLDEAMAKANVSNGLTWGELQFLPESERDAVYQRMWDNPYTRVYMNRDNYGDTFDDWLAGKKAASIDMSDLSAEDIRGITNGTQQDLTNVVNDLVSLGYMPSDYSDSITNAVGSMGYNSVQDYVNDGFYDNLVNALIYGIQNNGLSDNDVAKYISAV